MQASGFLLLFLLLAACEHAQPPVRFDAPFAEGSRQLIKGLGPELTLKHGSDTLHLRLRQVGRHTLITHTQSADTLFWGQATRFRGVYYLSRQLKSGDYQIQALYRQDNLLYGLTNAGEQSLLLHQAFFQGNYQHLLKAIASDSSLLLRMERKPVRQLFAGVLAQISPDTLLPAKQSLRPKPLNPAPAILADDGKLLTRIFPNPARELLHFKFQSAGILNYRILNQQGRVMIWGRAENKLGEIVVASLEKGIYILTVTDPATGRIGQARFLKQ